MHTKYVLPKLDLLQQLKRMKYVLVSDVYYMWDERKRLDVIYFCCSSLWSASNNVSYRFFREKLH